MFDVGFSELALIGLIALLVLGPERLPPLVRTAGRWLGRAQRMARELKTQLENDPSMRELKEFQQTLKSTEGIPTDSMLPKAPGSLAALAEQQEKQEKQAGAIDNEPR